MNPAAYTVRPSVPGDLTALDALLAASYPALLRPDYPPSVMVTALPLISRAQPALLASGTYFVAETAEGRLLGAGGWTAGAPGSGERAARVGHVRHVVTDRRAVRRGVGRAIMEEVFRTSRAAGIGRLDCMSTRTAVAFYAALGFETLGPVEISLRPGIGFPAVAMRKML